MDPRRDTDAFESNFLDAFERSQVPGASAALLVGGNWREVSAGVLNVATRAEVTSDSLFQIGSVTKLITASLIMSRVQDRELSLDTRVVDVVSYFDLVDDDWARDVTIEHLLTHRGGFEGDVDADFGRGDDAIRRYVENLRNLKRGHRPGEVVSYSNSGFVVLGAVLEEVSGNTWAEVADGLFSAINLPEAETYPERALGWRTAHGHLHLPEQTVLHPLTTLPWAQSPAGASTMMSARSLVALGAALAGIPHTGVRVPLDPAILTSMQSTRVPAPSPGRPGKFRGLGWEIDTRHEAPTLIGHNGQTYGQNAYFWCSPARELAVGLLVNSDRDRQLMTATIMETINGLLEIEQVTPPLHLEPLPDEVSIQLSGRYGTASRTLDFIGNTVTIRHHEHVDRLTGADRPATFALMYSPSDGYVVALQENGAEASRVGIPSGWSGEHPPYVYMGNRAVSRLA